MRRTHQPSLNSKPAFPIASQITTHITTQYVTRPANTTTVRPLSTLPAGDFHHKFEKRHPSVYKPKKESNDPNQQKLLSNNASNKSLLTTDKFLNTTPATDQGIRDSRELTFKHVPSPAMANIDSSLYQFIDDKSWLTSRRKDNKLPPGLPPDVAKEVREFQSKLTVPMHIDTITTLALPKHLGGFGFKQLTYIQGKLLPIIASGIDVLLRAPSASGKTLSYVLPLIERLIYMRHQPNSRDVPIIILVPTKELALQTASVIEHALGLHKRSNTRNYGVVSLIGGTSASRVEQEPLQRTDIGFLVATTQRLIDHIDNTPGFKQRLKGTKMVVLDEVDYLLAQTGGLDIGKVLQHTNKNRQTIMLSATLTPAVRKVATYALRRGACIIDVVKDSIVTIGQDEKNKKAKLSELSDQEMQGNHDGHDHDHDEEENELAARSTHPSTTTHGNVMGYFVDEDGNKVEHVNAFNELTKAQQTILKQKQGGNVDNSNNNNTNNHSTPSQHPSDSPYDDALTSKPPMTSTQKDLLQSFASVDTVAVDEYGIIRKQKSNTLQQQDPSISSSSSSSDHDNDITISRFKKTKHHGDDKLRQGDIALSGGDDDYSHADHDHTSTESSDLHPPHIKQQQKDLEKAREVMDLTHVGSVGELLEQNKAIVDDLALYSDSESDQGELVLFNEVNKNVEHYIQACHSSDTITVITRLFDDIGGRFLYAKQQVDAYNDELRKSPTFSEQHTKLMDYPKPPKILVFCETARYAQFLALVFRRVLQTHEHPAYEAVLELHSKKNQNYRTRVLQGFVRDNWKLGCIMFASDVGSRGIDTRSVDCVIQLGMPNSRQQYVQRVGRVARAQGQMGLSLTLINPFETKTFAKMCAGLPIATPDVNTLGLGIKRDYFNNTRLYSPQQSPPTTSPSSSSTSSSTMDGKSPSTPQQQRKGYNDNEKDSDMEHLRKDFFSASDNDHEIADETITTTGSTNPRDIKRQADHEAKTTGDAIRYGILPETNELDDGIPPLSSSSDHLKQQQQQHSQSGGKSIRDAQQQMQKMSLSRNKTATQSNNNNKKNNNSTDEEDNALIDNLIKDEHSPYHIKTNITPPKSSSSSSNIHKFGYILTPADDFSSMDEFDETFHEELQLKRDIEHYERKVKLAIQYGNDIPPIPNHLVGKIPPLFDDDDDVNDDMDTNNDHDQHSGGNTRLKNLSSHGDNDEKKDTSGSEQEPFDYNTLFEGRYKFEDSFSSSDGDVGDMQKVSDNQNEHHHMESSKYKRRMGDDDDNSMTTSTNPQGDEEEEEHDEQGLWDGVVERACAGIYIDRLPHEKRFDRYENLFKMSMSSYTAGTTVKRHETMEWMIKKQLSAVPRDNELGLNAERAYVAFIGHHIALFNQSNSIQEKLIHAVKLYRSPYKRKQDICKIALDFAQGIGLCGPAKNKPPPTISEKVAARLGLKPNPYIQIGIPKIYPQSEFQDNYTSGSGSIQYTDDSTLNKKKRPPEGKKKKGKKEPMPGRHLLKKYSLQQTRPLRLRTGEMDYRHHEDIIM